MSKTNKTLLQLSIGLLSFILLPGIIIMHGNHAIAVKEEEQAQAIQAERAAKLKIAESSSTISTPTNDTQTSQPTVNAVKDDSIDQVVLNSKQPVKLSCVIFSNLKNKANKYDRKIVQITGYTNGTISTSYKAQIPLSSTIKSCLNEVSVFSGADTIEEGTIITFSTVAYLLSAFSPEDTGKGIYKITVKGMAHADTLLEGKIVSSSLTNCIITENIFLSYKKLEQYLSHPSWSSMMRSYDLVGSKVVIRARVIQNTGVGSLLACMGSIGSNILIDGDYYENNNKVIEGDYIKVVGELKGTQEYTTAFNVQVSVPEIDPDYIVYGGRED